MKYEQLKLKGVVLLTPEVFSDERGFFLETFRQSDFNEHCGNFVFVQDNHSKSSKGILRGLHYQKNNPQGKLVRVTKGEVYDVAVDLRQSSPTFGQWVGVILNDINKQLLWIPPGFAHGFYVMSDDAEFQYKCTDYYSPEDDVSILWNDVSIGIEWPAFDSSPVLSNKDLNGISFNSAPCF
ncbi:dTDP-4-dehydrorhamnose 3,5-epimerase [Amphritea sp.]|uniref:dTDP-4-dehydrorhamnose 3,5-epimerase n=1 Tax=Amphritea sp. TaxID=1872502 RepID=UPI003A8DB346